MSNRLAFSPIDMPQQFRNCKLKAPTVAAKQHKRRLWPSSRAGQEGGPLQWSVTKRRVQLHKRTQHRFPKRLANGRSHQCGEATLSRSKASLYVANFAENSRHAKKQYNGIGRAMPRLQCLALPLQIRSHLWSPVQQE